MARILLSIGTSRGVTMTRAAPKAKRILVVDDDPGVCDTLNTIICAGTPHYVEPCTDAVDALERVKSNPFNLVVTDIVMPGMDGLTLLERIKAVAPDVEAIVLTAYPTAENATSALRGRAYDFIGKPFDAQHMLDTLEGALAHQERAQQVHQRMESHAAANDQLRRRGRDLVGRDMARDRACVSRLLHRMFARCVEAGAERVRRASDAVDRLAAMCPHVAGEAAEQLRTARESIDGLRREIELFDERGPVKGLSMSPQVDLGQVVTARCQELSDYYPGVVVEIIAPGEPLKLEFDGEAIGLALLNILVNAAQSMGERGLVRVTVLVNAGVVEVAVRDNGPGFTSLALARATQPFWTTKGPPSAGLGLPVARQIVEEHRGSVALDNSPDRGAVVRIRLPRWRA
jgi:signal transduction histidine kinase